MKIEALFPWVTTDVRPELTKYRVFLESVRFHYGINLSGLSSTRTEAKKDEKQGFWNWLTSWERGNSLTAQHSRPPPPTAELQQVFNISWTSFSLAFSVYGFRRAQMDHLAYRAEREHVLHTYTKTDWLLFHQMRWRRTLSNFVFGGMGPGLKAASMGVLWSCSDILSSWARDRDDFVNSTIAFTICSTVFYASGLVTVNPRTLALFPLLGAMAYAGHVYFVPLMDQVNPHERQKTIQLREDTLARIREPDGSLEELQRRTDAIVRQFQTSANV